MARVESPGRPPRPRSGYPIQHQAVPAWFSDLRGNHRRARCKKQLDLKRRLLSTIEGQLLRNLRTLPQVLRGACRLEPLKSGRTNKLYIPKSCEVITFYKLWTFPLLNKCIFTHHIWPPWSSPKLCGALPETPMAPVANQGNWIGR